MLALLFTQSIIFAQKKKSKKEVAENVDFAFCLCGVSKIASYPCIEKITQFLIKNLF